MNERKHLYGLDHLRFFAATLVFAFHFSMKLTPDRSAGFLRYLGESWLRWGSNGVSLFLVLSGFLFVTIIGNRDIIYHKFIANRILRIFPLLIAVMLLLLTAARGTWSTDDLLRFLLLQINTGNPSTGWGSEILPFGVIWTIAVEFQFYLIFPILFLIFRKDDGIKNFVWMICAFITLRLFLGLYKGPDIYYNSYHTLLSRIDQFLIGMIAAKCWSNFAIRKYTSLALLILGLIILSVDVTNHKINLYRISLGLTVEAIAWSLIIIGYISIVNGAGKLTKFIASLGNLTYSIYLLHLFFSYQTYSYFLERGYGFDNDAYNFIFYAYLPILTLSYITYMGIERPFLQLKMRYIQ